VKVGLPQARPVEWLERPQTSRAKTDSPAQPIQKTASEGKASWPIHILQNVPDCNANHLSVSLIVGKVCSAAFAHSSQSAIQSDTNRCRKLRIAFLQLHHDEPEQHLVRTDQCVGVSKLPVDGVKTIVIHPWLPTK
jgi:hypothetical protein